LSKILRVLVAVLCILHPQLSPYLRACRHNAALRSHPFAALFCGTLRASEISPVTLGAFHAEEPRVRIVLSSPLGVVEDVLPLPSKHGSARNLLTQLVGSHAADDKVSDAKAEAASGDAIDARVVVFSDSPGFERFAGASDVYVPSADTSLGRYPYARRTVMQELSVHADMEFRAEPNAV
jgi:hypothetical protein